jgi:hypothetical protein
MLAQLREGVAESIVRRTSTTGEVDASARVFGIGSSGGIASMRERVPPEWKQLVEQGFTEPLIGVEVVNVGSDGDPS